MVHRVLALILFSQPFCTSLFVVIKVESFCCTATALSFVRTEKEGRNHSLYSPKLSGERNSAVFHQSTFSCCSVSFISSSPFVRRRFLRSFNFVEVHRQFYLKFCTCLTNKLHWFDFVISEGASFQLHDEK